MKFDCDVLIVGGGPVGLTLAGELGRRKVKTIVIDPKAGFHEHPRATYIGPRTLEFFRSWGIVDDVLEAAVPHDYPIDISFTETVAGEEFFRLSYPSISDCLERTEETLAIHPQLLWSRYGKIVIGQNILEPVIARFVDAQTSVTHLKEHTLTAFQEMPQGVAAVITTPDGGVKTVHAKYIVGCDGARSVVRQTMGVKYEGVGQVGESVNTFFRSDELLASIGKPPGAIFWVMKENVTGGLLAIDGRNHWVFSRHLLPDQVHVGEDPAIAIREALGCNVEFHVISSWPWIPRELVATNYTQGRAFLVGDAAHLLSPTGGYGLNTGIGDAVNLAWKLQAVIEGWGDAALLLTYERERKPIFQRNGTQATANRAVMRELMMTARDLSKESKRAAAIEQIVRSKPLHGKHFDGMGVYLGDRYDHSPIIASDTTEEPLWDAEKYRPTTKPGGRLPLVWSEPSTTAHDLCGIGFTLFTQDLNLADSFMQHARERRLPLKIVETTEQMMMDFQTEHLLVRPDGTVCWGSSSLITRADEVLDTVTGWNRDSRAQRTCCPS